MELIKVLANLKIKSYFMAALFLFSVTVPGVLILVHFYPHLFMTLDSLRLIMIIGAIGVGVLIFSYTMSSIAYIILYLRYNNGGLPEDDNDYIEVAFVWGSQILLLIIFFWFLVFHFTNCCCLGWYIFWVVISNIIHVVIVYFLMVYMLDNLVENSNKTLEEEQRDKIRNVIQLTNKLNQLKNQIRIYHKQKQEISGFKLFRSTIEKEKQIKEVDDKIKIAQDEYKKIENSINEMVRDK